VRRNTNLRHATQTWVCVGVCRDPPELLLGAYAEIGVMIFDLLSWRDDKSKITTQLRVASADFDRFERASYLLDVDTIATMFAEVFMSADPNGVTAVPRDAFVAALPQRQKLFDLMGASAIRLTALTENRLDDNYLLVDTERAADLRDPFQAPLGLSSSFLLRQNGESLEVVFYLNHQDILALAQSRATDLPR